MAKQMTDAFRGLLSGVDFVRNIQQDAEQEQRYQDEKAFREAEARRAAEQWMTTHKFNVEKFGKEFGLAEKSYGLAEKEYNLNKTNADRNYELAKTGQDESIRHNKATEESNMLHAKAQASFAETNRRRAEYEIDALEEQKQLRESMSSFEKKFLDAETVYSAPPIVTAEDMMASQPKTWWDEAKEMFPMSPLTWADDWFDISGKKADAKFSADAANAKNFATYLVEQKVPLIEKAIKEATSQKYGTEIVKQAGSSTIRKAIAEWEIASQYVKEGLITDKGLIDKIYKAGIKLLPYKYPTEMEQYAAKKNIDLGIELEKIAAKQKDK